MEIVDNIQQQMGNINRNVKTQKVRNVSYLAEMTFCL